MRLAGISEAELARFKQPATYRNDTGKALPQPAIDPTKPHMIYPEARYKQMVAMSDEEYTRVRSETTPPVQVAAE